jgi:hypothetical protein
MRRRLRHTTAAISATALLAVTGCGDTAAERASTLAGGGAGAATQAGRPGGGMPAASLKTLAGELGVSTTRLKAAMEASRPDAGTAGQPPSGDPTAALAKELDLSTAKVRAAMKAAGMGGGGAPPNGAAPPHGTAPSQSAEDSTQS